MNAPGPMSQWLPEGADSCAARRLLDRLGDKWSLLVLFHLLGGGLRFNALHRRIDGISQRILTVTLRGLERDGYISRTRVPALVAHVSYALTPLGSELVQLSQSVVRWAEAHDDQVVEAHRRFDRQRADQLA